MELSIGRNDVAMKMFALTDTMNIVKLKVSSENLSSSTRVIEHGFILDSISAEFSIPYTPKDHGKILIYTISENAEDIFNHLKDVESEANKKQLLLMNNIFFLNGKDAL